MKFISLLNEAQDYKQMFNDFFKHLAVFEKDAASKFIDNSPNIAPEDVEKLAHEMYSIAAGNDISEEIRWAKNVLKRNDRVVWYLRYVKATMYYKYAKNSTERDETGADAGKRITSTLELPFVKKWLNNSTNPTEAIANFIPYLDALPNMKTRLSHHLSLPIPANNAIIWQWQTVSELEQQFIDNETEWKKAQNERVPFDEDQEILIDFEDGFYWVNLNKNYCELEGNAMGHCGNGGNPEYGELIFSLRKKIEEGGATSWRPSLTFIRDEHGYLGEMKGRGNDKPAAKYHKYIIALLRSEYVVGIKGGGYLPENNFEIDDLPEEVADALIEEKPKLLTLVDRFKRFGAESIVEELTGESTQYKFEVNDNDTIDFKMLSSSSLFQDLSNHSEGWVKYISSGLVCDSLITDYPEGLAKELYTDGDITGGANLSSFIYNLAGYSIDEETARIVFPESVYNATVPQLMQKHPGINNAVHDAFKYYELSEFNLFDTALSYDDFIEFVFPMSANGRVKQRPLSNSGADINQFRRLVYNPIAAGVAAYYSKLFAEELAKSPHIYGYIVGYHGEQIGEIVEMDTHGGTVRMQSEGIINAINDSNFRTAVKMDQFNGSTAWYDTAYENAGIDDFMVGLFEQLTTGKDEMGKDMGENAVSIDYDELSHTILMVFKAMENGPNLVKNALQDKPE